LLENADFRFRVERFIARYIRAYLPGLTKDMIDSIVPEKELAWNRPIRPSLEHYDKHVADLERRVVRSQQIHTCSRNTCLRFDKKTGTWKCKRCAPWALAEEAYILPSGVWSPQRN